MDGSNEGPDLIAWAKQERAVSDMLGRDIEQQEIVQSNTAIKDAYSKLCGQ